MNESLTTACRLQDAPAAAVMGRWQPGEGRAEENIPLGEALYRVSAPLHLVREPQGCTARHGGTARIGDATADPGSLPLLGYASPCPPHQLGDPLFLREYGLRYPYVAGSMAKGISSAPLVEEMGRAGMLGFFGAAGLPLEAVEAAIDRLQASLGDLPFGMNLIHSPQEPDLEAAIADLYLRRGVRLVEASAFLELTLPLVRYRLAGIHRGPDGAVVAPNRVIAKVSREEVAARFFAPAPERLLRELVARGALTAEQAELAGQLPVADTITAEADSGGHTDNRPAVALFPTIASLAERCMEKYRYPRRLLVGLGGGIGTPQAAAAAFAMGAAYIVTGSVNQACVEAGTCAAVRAMLADTRQADVTMAPAADMFEMGVTVQVLKRGTMFAMRAARLYELYRAHPSLEAIPAAEREKLEKTVFRASLDAVWSGTRDYFLHRDPRQVERAERDPKHRMALVFRWYLGQAAHWARDGEPDRQMDYQVWCGPAMGAFNEWTAGSFLAETANRRATTVALNLLWGAAVVQRCALLRSQGAELPPETGRVTPLDPAQIKEYLR